MAVVRRIARSRKPANPSINSAHPWASSCIGFWPFWAGGDQQDISGYNQHATDGSSTRPAVKVNYGRMSLTLGSDLYYDVPSASLGDRFEWSENEPYTVIATVYYDTGTDSNAAFIGLGSTEGNEWMLGKTGSSWRWYSDAGFPALRGGTVATGWHNVIVSGFNTGAGGSMDVRLWVDGVSRNTSTSGNNRTGFNSKPLTLGSANSGEATRTWVGALEQVIILNEYEFLERDVAAYERNRYQLYAPQSQAIPTPAPTAAAGVSGAVRRRVPRTRY